MVCNLHHTSENCFFSLHDANLIGLYKIIYNVYDTIHHPPNFFVFFICRRLKLFKFCNKLVFELLAIALHYLSAAGVRLTRDRYYCIEEKIAGQCSLLRLLGNLN